MESAVKTPLDLARRCNGELAARALARGAGFLRHRPTQIYLQLASACNLSCYMCSEHNRPPEARHGKGLISFSPELFAKLEREVFPWSSQLFFGVGGEPTFSAHFVEFAQRSSLAGQELHVITNGTYLERDAVAESFAHHVAFAQVSIDAATPGSYERIRIGSRWKRLMAGLEALADLRRDARSGRRCHLSLCFVLMRSNVHELPAFVELAHELGADAVRAQHVIAMTARGSGESLVLEPQRYDELRAQAEQSARRLGLEFLAPAPFAASPDGVAAREPDLAAHAVPCRAPNQSAVILYDGRVFACCHPLAHEKMELGNLSERSFESIWNGRLWRNLRAGMKSGDVPRICRSCSIVHSPPPLAEDALSLQPDDGIAEHYGDRDLDPPPTATRPMTAADEAWEAYMLDLRAHADALQRDRDGLARLHAEERARLAQHDETLQSERSRLMAHVANLENERARLALHIANLERERPMLFAHIAMLEAERPELFAQLALMEGERPKLFAHIEKLETKLIRWRAYLAWPQRLGFGLVTPWLRRLEPRAPPAPRIPLQEDSR